MDYKVKYLKYKNKYLSLKEQIGSSRKSFGYMSGRQIEHERDSACSILEKCGYSCDYADNKELVYDLEYWTNDVYNYDEETDGVLPLDPFTLVLQSIHLGNLEQFKSNLVILFNESQYQKFLSHALDLVKENNPIRRNSLEILERIVNTGVPMDKQKYFLHDIFKSDTDEIRRRQILEILIKHNYNINIQDRDGNTLLHLATIPRRKNLNIITMLLDNGADVSIQNNHGEIPIDINHPKIIPIVLKWHNNELLMKAIYENNLDRVREIIKSRHDTSTYASRARGPELYKDEIILATKFNRLEILEILFENGIRINPDIIKNSLDQTPLHIAASKGYARLFDILKKMSTPV